MFVASDDGNLNDLSVGGRGLVVLPQFPVNGSRAFASNFGDDLSFASLEVDFEARRYEDVIDDADGSFSFSFYVESTAKYKKTASSAKETWSILVVPGRSGPVLHSGSFLSSEILGEVIG